MGSLWLVLLFLADGFQPGVARRRHLARTICTTFHAQIPANRPVNHAATAQSGPASRPRRRCTRPLSPPAPGPDAPGASGRRAAGCLPIRPASAHSVRGRVQDVDGGKRGQPPLGCHGSALCTSFTQRWPSLRTAGHIHAGQQARDLLDRHRDARLRGQFNHVGRITRRGGGRPSGHDRGQRQQRGHFIADRAAADEVRGRCRAGSRQLGGEHAVPSWASQPDTHGAGHVHHGGRDDEGAECTSWQSHPRRTCGHPLSMLVTVAASVAAPGYRGRRKAGCRAATLRRAGRHRSGSCRSCRCLGRPYQIRLQRRSAQYVGICADVRRLPRSRNPGCGNRGRCVGQRCALGLIDDGRAGSVRGSQGKRSVITVRGGAGSATMPRAASEVLRNPLNTLMASVPLKSIDGLTRQSSTPSVSGIDRRDAGFGHVMAAPTFWVCGRCCGEFGLCAPDVGAFTVVACCAGFGVDIKPVHPADFASHMNETRHQPLPASVAVGLISVPLAVVIVGAPTVKLPVQVVPATGVINTEKYPWGCVLLDVQADSTPGADVCGRDLLNPLTIMPHPTFQTATAQQSSLPSGANAALSVV